MANPRMSWPLTRVNTTGVGDGSQYEDRNKKNGWDVEVTEVSSIHSGSEKSQVVGSADMFDENGNIRLIPVSASMSWNLTKVECGCANWRCSS